MINKGCCNHQSFEKPPRLSFITDSAEAEKRVRERERGKKVCSHTNISC